MKVRMALASNYIRLEMGNAAKKVKNKHLKGYFQMGFNPNKQRKHTIKFTKRLQNFVVSCVYMR